MILDDLRILLAPAEMTRFMAAFAGTDVLFPKTPEGTSFAHLARVIGLPAAEKLRQHFAGELLYVPRNLAEERVARDEEIRARIAAGESPADIARSYRVVTTISARHVRRIAAEGRARALEGASEAALERTMIVDRHVASATAAVVHAGEKIHAAGKRLAHAIPAPVPKVKPE